MTRRTRTGATAFAALTVVAAFTLSACAPAADSPTTETSPSDTIIVTDPWVMSAEDGMSAAFGKIENPTGRDLTVVSATSPASPTLELHETVENETGEMVMRQIEGGFVISAESTLTLEPGGDHIMLMGLADPLLAGDDIAFTLTFDDGSTYEYTAPVKDYAGGNETYEGSDEDHSEDMNH